MANLFGLDAAGNIAYVKSTGTGTAGDPYLVQNDTFIPELKSAFIAASGNADVASGVASTKLRVLSLAITSSAAATVKLQSGGSADLTPPFHLAANGNLTLSNELGLFETASAAKLNAVVSGTTNYTVLVAYREVPV
jgi:hypothetical protein